MNTLIPCSHNEQAGQLSLHIHSTGAVSGAWTMLLWRAAYASELASWRTRLLVMGDWSKSYVFGRDSSRI